MGIDRYKDIIGHEHHVSSRHQHMSVLDRAAQFAPFAALTGYDAIIRDVERKNELQENKTNEDILDYR